MRSVVITGSTRGIGFGLADVFLQRGCAVTISGRSQGSVDQAVAQLAAKYSADRVIGRPCDVSVYEQMQALWDAAKAKFGAVDIWINNAGVGQDSGPSWELPLETIRAIVDTNLLGSIFGTQVALRGMLAQGSGQIYNMEGLGSEGIPRFGFSVYGSTKRAIRFLTQSLVNETKGKPVIIGRLSPGMVITDLLISPFENDPKDQARSKRIFNILADRVETVAPFLVDHVLANTKTGAFFEWLTRGKIARRFMLAPFQKRNILD